MFATWLCLPPVCPSKASVNPGRLSSQTWKRPLNGCLPLSANTLAEAEGGSGAGAAPRPGFSQPRAGLASAPPALLCDVVVMACTHTADRRGEGRAGGEGIFHSGSESVLWWIFERTSETLSSELCVERLISAAVVTSFIHPLCSSDPPVPSAIVNSFNLVIRRPPPLFQIPAVLSAFAQAAQRAA